MSLYIIMYRESVREIVESEEFAQVVSDSTRQHFKVHRHTNLTVVSLVIYQRECLQKMKGGIGLRRKKGFQSLLILLLSAASIRRKLLKTTYSEERGVPPNSKSLFFAVSIYPLSFFTNTPFKIIQLLSHYKKMLWIVFLDLFLNFILL